MVRMTGICLLLLSANVSAQQLYKCINGKGHPSYQSEPCNAQQRQVWVRDATPDPEPSPAQRRAAQAQQRQLDTDAAERRQLQRQAQRSQRPTGFSLPAYSGSQPSACQAAKDNRERVLKAVGMNRSYNLLRRLDDEVWSACNR